MPERLSPLTNVMQPGTYGESASASDLILRELPVAGIAQIVGWDRFCPTISEAFGIDRLLDKLSYKFAFLERDFTIFRLAPTRLQIHCPDIAAMQFIAQKLDSAESGFIDLGHARTRLCLSGPNSQTILQRVAPLDFDVATFPTGEFRQSGIHHIAILFQRISENTFELTIPTTWAVSVFRYIHESALSCGYEIPQP